MRISSLRGVAWSNKQSYEAHCTKIKNVHQMVISLGFYFHSVHFVVDYCCLAVKNLPTDLVGIVLSGVEFFQFLSPVIIQAK